MNFIKLTHDKLSLDSILELVSSPSCGALSFFVGTTRDNFEGKKVLSLEYEAYESMAVRGMEDLCSDIRSQWKTVEKIAIYHRLGSVPVKESSVIIAISSPHRAEAMKATEWCIDNLKKSVPIWKKEIYEDEAPEWKENKESPSAPEPKPKKSKLEIKQEVDVPYVAPHLLQVKASKEEVFRRIQNLMERKRSEINVNNISEFCSGDRNSEFICARIDAKLKKRKDSKGHLQEYKTLENNQFLFKDLDYLNLHIHLCTQLTASKRQFLLLVDRVLNSYYQRDQINSDYLTKYIPPNGIEERMQNLECQLSLTTPTPRNIYIRLKDLEDRLLKLESISPEYIQFWDKTTEKSTKPVKKKIFSIEEIDALINDLAKKLRK